MAVTYSSADDLARALERAATAHGVHEAETGVADPDWPDWYASFMDQERSGDQRSGPREGHPG